MQSMTRGRSSVTVSIGAFLMDPDGTVQYLPEFSIAHDINEAGQVVGIGYAGALLWSNGQTTHLGALPGAFNGTNSEAYALNETPGRARVQLCS